MLVKALKAPVYKGENLKKAFLRVPGTGKVLQVGWQREGRGVRPLTRPWLGTTQQGFPARQ